MFPEFRDLISKLKTTDAHFAKLFDLHNEIDQKIKNIADTASDTEIEVMKKEKLHLKDQLHTILKSHNQVN